MGEGAEALGIGVGHIGEAGAEGVIIGSGEGIGALEIDVVVDEDEGAAGVGEVDGAGGVGDDEGLNAEASHDADALGDLAGGVALVEMVASGHDERGDAMDAASDEASGVSDGGGGGPAGDFGIRDFDAIGEFVGESAESAAEDHAHAGLEVDASFNVEYGVVHGVNGTTEGSETDLLLARYTS
jgi:hypothetical protein